MTTQREIEEMHGALVAAYAALNRIATSASHEEAVTRAKVALGQLGVGALLAFENVASARRFCDDECVTHCPDEFGIAAAARARSDAELARQGQTGLDDARRHVAEVEARNRRPPAPVSEEQWDAKVKAGWKLPGSAS